jgi:sulfofructose kinase
MQPMLGKRVVVVGHAALDSICRIEAFPEKPAKVQALERIESGGGTAANAAAAIAKLGGKAELWSRTGEDEAGSKIRRSLEDAGVNVTYVLVQHGARSPVSTVIVDAKGERLIVSEDDHDMPMASDWLPIQRIKAAGAVLSDLSWLEGTAAAFRAARANGVPTVLDVDLGSGELLCQNLSLTDYVIMSEPAFEHFIDGSGREDKLLWLISKGVQHTGVTCGVKGYHWLSRDGVQGFQEAFAVDAIDTTGAGDAFHGAFVLGLSCGLDDAECARLGSAVAALKCRRLGARAGLPAAREVDGFLRDNTGHGLAAGLLCAII